MVAFQKTQRKCNYCQALDHLRKDESNAEQFSGRIQEKELVSCK
jgi:hypothetical protein